MERETGFRLTPGLLAGVAIIVLGIIFVLTNLEVIDAEAVFDYLWDYWPVVLIGIGLLKLTQVSRTRSWFAPAIFILIGSWVLLYNLEVIDVDFFDMFWPLLLILLGTAMVRRALGRELYGGHIGVRQKSRWNRRATEDDSTLNIFAFMCGQRRGSSAKDFRGGDLTAIMGGCEIDLRQAVIADGEAVVDVLAFWGGIDLRVPKEWTVVSKVGVLMGGLEDKTDRALAKPDQRLLIKGLVVMGGVEIHN